MSFEPLSWDVSDIIAKHPNAINWAIIGAASNGRNVYPPAEADFRALQDVLDSQNVKTFYKGNLDSLQAAADGWREDFPTRTVAELIPCERCNETGKLDIINGWITCHTCDGAGMCWTYTTKEL